MTFSLGSRYPANRPNAAKTSAPSHGTSPQTIHCVAVSWTPTAAPIANSTSTAASPSTIAVTTLVAM